MLGSGPPDPLLTSIGVLLFGHPHPVICSLSSIKLSSYCILSRTSIAANIDKF